MQDGAVARIAEACLEAPLVRTPWAHVADALAHEVGERRIVIVTLAPGWSPFGPSFAAGLDPEALPSVVEVHHRTNPWAGISRRYPPGYFGHGYDEITPDEVRAGAFYNEWMVPFGLGSDAVYGGFPVLRDGVDELLVTVMGRTGAPPLEPDEVAVCETAMRYFQRTFLMLETLAQAGSRSGSPEASGEQGAGAAVDAVGWSTRVLDRIRIAAVVADAGARVEYANEAASAMFDAGDGLACLRGRLCLPTLVQTGRLRELVACAASNVAAGGGALVVETAAGALGGQVIVTPLPGVGATPERALVMAAPPGAPTGGTVEILRGSFGLTRAEARLAARLATLLDLRASADAEQISYETARTYFKRAADKLGVRSQAAAIDRIRLLGLVDDLE